MRLAKHLEALHLHGVAHGNISPACILIEAASPLSRGLVADVRRTSEMIQYHSPERFRNGQLSPLDDAWALAGTLFTMLTGARPFGELRPEIEARVYQGVPPLGAYGINDDQLYAIIAAALSPDATRRTQNVTTFRLHLEHWANDPQIRALLALEDEEGGEDDQAATAMVAMEAMVFEEPSTSRPESLASIPDSNLFAPPSFDPLSSVPGVPTAPRPSRPQAPEPVSQSPLGEQDATVMRALPAHIIAMAARAASGSSPPPPLEPPPPPLNAPGAQPSGYQPPGQTSGYLPPDDEPDFGQATKMVPAPDMAAVLLQSRDPAPPMPNQPMGGGPMGGGPMGGGPMGGGPMGGGPMGGGPPGPPRAVPRAFKQTQLGMGGLGAQQPAAPRPGFNPPPDLQSSPPARDPDDVRTVMHDAGAYPFPQPQGLAAPNLPLANEPDDDDGGRTVMRESPALSAEMFQNPAPQAQWKPAPPPVQPRPFGGVAQTDRPPGQSPAGGAPLPSADGGVSALIQETLRQQGGGSMGGMQQGMGQQGMGQQGMGQQGMPGGPSGQQFQEFGHGSMGPGGGGPFEPTGGLPGPFQPAGGPFQPIGLQGSFPGPSGQFELAGGPGGQGMQGSMLDSPSMETPPPLGLEQAAGGYPLAPGQAQPQPQKGGSRAGLFVVCLLVLVLAAALTFLALKFRPQLGF